MSPQNPVVQRRHFLSAVGVTATAGIAGCVTASSQAMQDLTASSPAFDAGEELPVRFTCEGEGISPPFGIEHVPESAVSLAVIAKADLGGITKPTLWTLWNVPVGTERIPANIPRVPTVSSLDGALQGKRRGGEVGYIPPCPPVEQTYTHWFQIYAVNKSLTVSGGSTHETAIEEIEAGVLASTRISVPVTRPLGTRETLETTDR
jgi:Raf kinase inhibitor-like YbhB/YbcL family protein